MPRAPRELTSEEVAQVEAWAACLTHEQIADRLGMHHDTLRAIRKRQPEVDRAYKRGRAEVIRDIASSLISKARDGDTTSQIFFLKTQAGWREKDRPEDAPQDDDARRRETERAATDFVSAVARLATRAGESEASGEPPAGDA